MSALKPVFETFQLFLTRLIFILIFILWDGYFFLFLFLDHFIKA